MLQNIPLRGHRDSAKNDEELAENELTNLGNLVELLWHRVENFYGTELSILVITNLFVAIIR